MRITEAGDRRPGQETSAGEGLRAGPAVPRMVLGERLRRLREAQFLTRRDAAEAIRVSDVTIAHLELGRSGFPVRDVTDLLLIYGVTDEAERATLLALAGQANTPGWWEEFADVVPSWLDTYLGLEQAAEVMRAYEVQFVPGLLQTREYARAVIALGEAGRADRAAAERRLERRLELRMLRQQVLYGPHPPHLWVVVDEAALRRPFGGRETMRGQLRHLIDVCELPHVTVQVLPFAAGGHAAAGGSVTLLRLPERELPDVIYLEHLVGASCPEDREDIALYRRAIDHTVTQAAPATRTREFLEHVLAET